MRRIVFLLLALLALGFFATRPAGEGVHVSGDGAGSLAAHASARDPDGARLKVILLRRWQNLEGLPAIARLCRAACDGSDWAVLLNVPGLRGLRRTLLLDLSALGAGAVLDGTGTLPPDVVACLIAGLDRPPGSAICDRPVRSIWRLPGGL